MEYVELLKKDEGLAAVGSGTTGTGELSELLLGEPSGDFNGTFCFGFTRRACRFFRELGEDRFCIC